MERLRELCKLLLVGVLAASGAGFTGFYCVFHLGSGVPLTKLVRPYAIVAFLTLLMVFPLSYARKRLVETGEAFLLYVTLGCYAVPVLFVYVHYGLKLGVLKSSQATQFYVFVLLCGCLVGLFAIRSRKKSFPGRADATSSKR